VRGQKVKNSNPSGKIEVRAFLYLTEEPMEWQSRHEVIAGFHLPASQRQMKKIISLRSLRLCGEFKMQR
jgi:hypothetical protein